LKIPKGVLRSQWIDNTSPVTVKPLEHHLICKSCWTPV